MIFCNIDNSNLTLCVLLHVLHGIFGVIEQKRVSDAQVTLHVLSSEDIGPSYEYYSETQAHVLRMKRDLPEAANEQQGDVTFNTPLSNTLTSTTTPVPLYTASTNATYTSSATMPVHNIGVDGGVVPISNASTILHTTTNPIVNNHETTTMLPETTESTSDTNATFVPVYDVKPEDDHKYYASKVVTGSEADELWIDNIDTAIKHVTLSSSHRTAATVKLTFTFLYYGHEVDQVTIATGGFLYVSNFLHQWLTAYQYIAPLMANFDTKIGNTSDIYYLDTGSALMVYWKDVSLQEKPGLLFQFQAILYQNGTIVFSYKSVPLSVPDIPDAHHPVKVGCSDAWYHDQPISAGTKRRSIYGYHKVDINKTLIANRTSIIITPQPTCIGIKDCTQCITADIGFQCSWCSVGRCSDGMDRMRQDWQHHDCDNANVVNISTCDKYPYVPFDHSNPMAKNVKPNTKSTDTTTSDGGLSPGGAVLVILVMSLIGCLVGFLTYAYKHPQSRAGIWLLENRPSILIDKITRRVCCWNPSRSAEKYQVSMHSDAECIA